MSIEEDFKELKQKFLEFNHLLTLFLIPFTLSTDKGLELTEDLEKENKEIYNELKESYEEFLCFCKSFFEHLKSADYPTGHITSLSDKFSKKLDKKIEDTVEFCTELIQYPENGISKEDAKLIEDIYFAYLILVRCFNSFIRIYNNSKPENKILELKNIPDPKYLDNVFNLSEFMQEYNTFEKLIQFCDSF